MDRHERKRLKKKHERRERIRRAKHERRQGVPVPVENPDEDGSIDENHPEAEPGLSPFLWEPSIRNTCIGFAVSTMPGAGDPHRAFLEDCAGGDALSADAVEELNHEESRAVRDMRRRLIHTYQRTIDQEADVLAELMALAHGPQETLVHRTSELADKLGVLEECRKTGRLLPKAGEEFWRELPGRLYLRTRKALLDVMLAADRVTEASTHAAALLELDPADHLRVRWTLLGHFLAKFRLPAARTILDALAGEESAVLAWARVLERFLAGDRRGASCALRIARARYPRVEGVLVPTGPDPRDPVTLEAKSETTAVIAHLGRAWRLHPEALEWLEDGGRATTPEERAAASAAYAPPVAALLSIGETGFSTSWPDYQSEHRIGPEHGAALVQMATDVALHEHDRDSPAVWAPIHAWRALAQLEFEAAAEPLCRLISERADDDWVGEELPRVLAALGPASFEPLAALAGDKDAEFLARWTAIEGLSALVAGAPELSVRYLEFLRAQLGLFEEQTDEFNGVLVHALLDAGHDPRDLELVEQAFAAERVDASICGELVALKELVHRSADGA